MSRFLKSSGLLQSWMPKNKSNLSRKVHLIFELQHISCSLITPKILTDLILYTFFKNLRKFQWMVFTRGLVKQSAGIFWMNSRTSEFSHEAGYAKSSRLS